MPWWKVGVLALSLVMFAQTFQYLIDVYPLYALSKMWPLLTLPMFAWGMARLDFPHKLLLVLTLAWVLGVAPVMSVLQLGTTLPDALATTVKVWCFTTPVAGAAMLVWLRPSPRLLRQILAGLGWALWGGLVAVWVLVPASVYESVKETKLLMFDDERGYHLFMPIYFGLLLMFALNRSFWIKKRLWKLAGIAAGLVILFVIYKERATIGGAVLVLVLGTVLSVRPRIRPAAFAVLALLGSVGLLFVIGRLQSPDVNQSLGGSLSIRKNSVATALDFLSVDPLRWIFGAGAATRVGTATMGDLLHNPSFFLADIGWLGVVFEYGVIGSILLFLVHLAALQMTWRSAKPDDPIVLGMGDYILYVLLTSPIYSVVFTPGEVLVCMPIAWYLSRSGPAGRRVLV